MSDVSYTPPANGWRTFVILWATQSLSVFGSAITGFATTIWLTQTAYPAPEQRQELAFALSAVGIAFFAAGLVAAPIGGAWADRHDRRWTMLITDVLSGLVSIALIALLVAGALNLWILLALLVVAGVANTFHDSAFDASYAMLVAPEQLPRANGMMQTIWSLSGIFSPALAAGVIALPALARQGALPGGASSWLAGLRDGTPLAIGVDVATFLVAVGALLLLRIPMPPRQDLAEDGAARPSIWADVREGGLYIWRRRSMLWLLGTFTVANFAGAPVVVLEPLLVKFNLAADWAARGFTFETALALVSSALGVGGVLGGVAMSAWGGLKRRRIYGVLIPMIASGVLQMVYGLSPLLYLTAGAGLAMMVTMPILNAHSQSIWQTQTPRELQGRVFSVRRVIAQFTFPIGTIIAGVTGGVFNPGHVVAAMGALLALFCTAQLFNPYLLRVEDKAWLDEMAAKRASAAP
jgi:MFS transporter, DHA3 family, macrolide efflux protein